MGIVAPLHDDIIGGANGAEKAVPTANQRPVLSHRMKHDKSILALAVSSQYIFAGTQGGEILVQIIYVLAGSKLRGAGLQPRHV